MNPRPDSNDAGYSPLVSIELLMAGQVFNVAAVGGDLVTLRDARLMSAGEGIIRMIVAGNATEYAVNLPEGVEPLRATQNCRIVRAMEHVTA